MTSWKRAESLKSYWSVKQGTSEWFQIDSKWVWVIPLIIYYQFVINQKLVACSSKLIICRFITLFFWKQCILKWQKSSNNSSKTQYLPLSWPELQLRPASEPNFSLSQNILISWCLNRVSPNPKHHISLLYDFEDRNAPLDLFSPDCKHVDIFAF